MKIAVTVHYSIFKLHVLLDNFGFYVKGVSRVWLRWGTLGISLRENSDMKIYSAEKSAWNQQLLPITALSCVAENSHCFTRCHQTHTNTHTAEHFVQYSAESCPTWKITATLNHAWGDRAAGMTPVQYKSNNGWEFLYGWATPNKTCSWRHCSVLLLHVGWSVPVPNTPSEVNGLMDGPWIRDLFT